MKQSRVCPKCGGTDILIFEGYAGAYGSGNHIMPGHSIFSAVPIDRHICCGCGFVEEWVREEDMEKLRKSKKGYR